MPRVSTVRPRPRIIIVQQPISQEEKKYKIKEMIINQFKSFTQNNQNDLFRTFTTKIPYQENIIFEYRDLNVNIVEKLNELKKNNIIPSELSETNTLDIFRRLNEYNKSHGE
jgi:hypothetical protein